MKLTNGLFIFHRDLRIRDNIGLIEASNQCEHLYVCFIFTPEQVGNNPYKSNNSVQFMIESLDELHNDIAKTGGELMLFYGKQKEILSHLISDLSIDGVYFNEDYSPYALERDEETAELCSQKKIRCEMFPDYYLYTPGTIKSSKSAYKKYTPFYRAVLHKAVAVPNMKNISNISRTSKSLHKQITIQSAFKNFTKPNPEILVHGGRSLGIQRLKLAQKNQKHYDKERDFFIENTTFLSAYIKFGCVSIREVYHVFKHEFGLSHGLIRELIWRDFYANVLFSFPYVLGHAMKPSYDKIRWHKNAKWLNAWKTGTTGFPVVDAGMRQLAETGYMHNRARLITSSFLIKVLLIDWQDGEKYFAQQLTDYDPASNNGNWQWGASTGADSQPYFRIFNPWLQSEEYDPDAEYIKQWVPELREVDAKVIHKWYKYSGEKEFKGIKYPAPIVDYSKQKEIALKMYSSVFK